MDDVETKNIEESTNSLIIYIRRYVNEILFEYNKNFGLEINYNVRNEIILHTFRLIVKKYAKNSNFDDKKSEIVTNIVKSFIIKKYGMD